MRFSSFILTSVLMGWTLQSNAHFQMVIPSDDILEQPDSMEVSIDLLFWHPLEGIGMDMAKPEQFSVYSVRDGVGKKVDLLPSLSPVKRKDREGKMKSTFQSTYSLKHPGDHVFYVEPVPYWEPAEGKFIKHYTKVVVDGFGGEQAWDTELGLKTEIIPLTRPYGIYTGNVFQGVVKVNGKPVPYSEIEVEYYDEKGEIEPAADAFITQVIKADANGVFTYAMPKSGWWGFAALNEGEKKLSHEGENYPVEIGALIWVKTHDMQ